MVVLDADGDRLRVSHAGRRRVTAAARVVVVDRGQLIEPQKVPETRQPAVDLSPESIVEGALDRAREAMLTKNGCELAIQLAIDPCSGDPLGGGQRESGDQRGRKVRESCRRHRTTSHYR